MKLINSLSIIMFAFAACRSSVNTKTNYSEALNLTSESDSDQMFFIVFQITAEANKNKITLVSKATVKGKIKSLPPAGNPVNHLLISLLNKDKKSLQSAQVEHPLLKEVEYAKPGGESSRKALNLDEAEFFVRLKYSSDAEWVMVEEIINGDKRQVTEFKIK